MNRIKINSYAQQMDKLLGHKLHAQGKQTTYMWQGIVN